MKSEVEEIASWLAALTSEALQRESPDLSAPFLGRHEIANAGARLTAEITRRRNLYLPENIVDHCPSPRLLAEWMCRNADRIYDPIIRFRGSEPSRDASDILFCIHPVSGVGTVFKRLAGRLTPRFRTFALSARGLKPGETPPDSFDGMVSRYADRVAEISSGELPHLLGWSFGGQIAEAVAIELQRRGHPTGLLLLIDSWVSHEALAERPPPLPTYDEYLREKYAFILPDQLVAFETMDEEQRVRKLVEKLVQMDAFSKRAAQMPLPAIKRMLNVAFRLDAMFRRCRPPSYPGRTLLVRAEDNVNWGYDAVEQWRQIANNLWVEHLPYRHLAMFTLDESVEAIAALVSRCCGAFGRQEHQSVV